MPQRILVQIIRLLQHSDNSNQASLVSPTWKGRRPFKSLMAWLLKGSGGYFMSKESPLLGLLLYINCFPLLPASSFWWGSLSQASSIEDVVQTDQKDEQHFLLVTSSIHSFSFHCQAALHNTFPSLVLTRYFQQFFWVSADRGVCTGVAVLGVGERNRVSLFPLGLYSSVRRISVAYQLG